MNTRRLLQQQRMTILSKCERNQTILWQWLRLLSHKIFPAIPPLLFDGEISSNFSLSLVITSQCTPLQTLSSLPALWLKTDQKLSFLNICEDDIFAVIENLNSNKSHGWNALSIKMIKSCRKSIAYLLKVMIEAFLLGGEFPECWESANVVPAHLKENKNLVENYRPISPLPIFGKYFERIIFKVLFNYLHKNGPFNNCQTGFLPGDSCI